MAKQLTKPSTETQSQTINIISETTSIRGDIISKGDIRIDGELIGNIDASGRLVIGPQGRLEGEVKCKNIEVAGYVKGKIYVTDLLTMKESAKICGDIFAGKLSVEPGSLFTGTCSMESPENTNDKQKKEEQKKV